jgi:acyl-coenzyme A synthetase/AMP-(fatty) acid ligase
MSDEMCTFDYGKEYKNWKWNIPEYYNIGYDCVDKHADGKNKNTLALLFENSEGKVDKYTFYEMKLLTNKFGNILRGLNFKKGDRILLRLPDVPEFQICFIGSVKIGAVPIPSSTMFRGKEVSYRINDSKAKAVVTTSHYVNEVNEIRKSCSSLKYVIIIDSVQENDVSYKELMNKASTKLELEKTKSTDISFFCYTSGTTGNPKGAVHLHRWVPGNDPSLLYWQYGKPGDIIGHTGNLSWIYPLGNGFLYPWRWGITTMIYDGIFSAKKWFSLIEKHKITNLASVPTCYRLFLKIKDAEKHYDLSSLQHCISAGEPLNPEVVNEWNKRFGLQIHDGIGMTEIMVYLSNMKNMTIKPGSCGKPQPGKQCNIVDEHGNILPQNLPGILAINKNDPGLFKEYWNKPQETSKSFQKDWFLTGDVLYKDEEGYFWFSGRDDDLIMASGYRISPFEVESTLISHPEVHEAAVVASPNQIRGVIVKAFIILNDSTKASDELKKDIQEYSKTISAPYKYPREIEFVDELPKTQSGKIKRKILREREKDKKILV